MFMQSGREVRCTPDHRWYTARSGSDGYHPTYQAAHIGSTLMRACTVDLPALTAREQRLGGWLGGFFDGEGSFVGQTISFTQGAVANSALCERLEQTLDELGLPWSKRLRPHPAQPEWQDTNWYWLRGGIETLQKFIHVAQPTKWRERMGEAYVGNARWIIERDKVVAIEPDGVEDVYALETTTGNYIAWGYASSNSAQYQQRPVPRAGAILDPGLFRATDEQVLAAAQTVRVQFWDTAFSAKQTADHTVAVTLDAETGGLERLWLRSVLRERHDATPDPARPEQPTRLDQALADHIVATRPTLVGIEEAAFKKRAVADMVRRIQKLLRARGVSISVKPIPVDGDKVTRARIVEGRLKAGDLYADHAMAGWTAYAAELAAFPMRKEDDQVDATSGAVTMAIEHVALVVQARELAGLAGHALSINRPQVPDPDQAQARHVREMIGRG
jgi:predicted phage terminase large subunit-like protein